MTRHSITHAILALVVAGALAGAAVRAAPSAPSATVRMGGALVLYSHALRAALATPAITMTPPALPRGGIATVRGTGFTPHAKLALFVVIDRFHNARVQLANLTAGADGRFATTAGPNGHYKPGPFTLVVVSAGVDLAQATIRVTDAPSIAPERLTTTPLGGMAGTRFTATGMGFAAGTTVVAFTTESAKGPKGHFRAVGKVLVPADGRVRFSFVTTGYHPESYDLIVFGPGGPQLGLPLVVIPFMVTGHAQDEARVVYVALGDGHTNDGGGDHPISQDYPALLARHLPPGARFFNLARIQNALSDSVLVDVRPTLAAHPTLITVWLGIADIAFGSNTPPATYRGNLDILLTALQRTHARVFIGNMPDLRFFHDPDSRAQAKNGLAYNAIIADEARRHGAVVVNVYAVSKAIWGHPELLTGEGYDVPNARGQAVLAALFYGVMHAHGAL
jgi:acyl-CoA thioesterase I